MSKELFGKILNKIKNHSKHLYFHVLGEPMLHPQIDEFLDMCHENDFIVNITTNGTLLKSRGKKILGKPALRQINISLHSFEGNENNYSMDEYLGDVFEFVNGKLTNQSHIVSLRLWNLLNNEGNQNNEYIFDWIKGKFDITETEFKELEIKNSLKIRENLYLNLANRFKWPSLNGDDEGSSGFCHGLTNQMAILVDGTIVPCCLDGEGSINLGNVITDEIDNVLNSNRANNIIHGFRCRNITEELCRRCNYRVRFKTE